MHSVSFKGFVINHSGLRDYITTHLNSNCALFYNKALKIEIYFLNKTYLPAGTTPLGYVKADLPEHDFPLIASWKPVLQEHVNEPTVLVQVCSQPEVPLVHSSMSVTNHYISCHNT